MKILAIESSCDETGAAVLENKNGEIKVLSNILATSSDMHATTGGIIPENAAREQVKAIIPVIIQALFDSNLAIKQFNNLEDKQKYNLNQKQEEFKGAKNILKNSIDAIAVTYGPGLIGSLLIGVETAKTLSFALNKPLIPVNHLLAHIYANFIVSDSKSYKLKAISFPFIGLIVSGGHTDLLYFKSHDDYKWLGGTRDDAAGEALDKIGRMLNLSYPAGPEMEKRANEFRLKANSSKLTAIFHSPMISSKDFDFSFSGLKAEVMRYIKERRATSDFSELKVAKKDSLIFDKSNKRLSLSEDGEAKNDSNNLSERHSNSNSESFVNEVCFATQKAIIDVLVKKTLAAAEKYNCQTILLGGGVSANQTLLEKFKQSVISNKSSVQILAPQKEFATDNAAMIGAYALIAGKTKGWESVKSNPELYFD